MIMGCLEIDINYGRGKLVDEAYGALSMLSLAMWVVYWVLNHM